MKAKYLAFGVAIVATLLVSGVAQANIAHFKIRGEFAFPVDTCVETVPLTGKFQISINVTADNAGGFHFDQQITAIGEGIGELTGVMYRWNDAIKAANFHFTPGGTYVSHSVTKTSLVSEGSTENFMVFLHSQLTQTPDGEFVVDKFELRTECTPD
jgi:hypothetical protein